MLADLESRDEIIKIAERLLAKTGAYGRFPTPVDDLVAASGLVEPRASLLSDLVLEKAPAYIRKAVARLKQKVQALLDRKTREIHLLPEEELNSGRRAFKKLHEVTHHCLPWQAELAYADDDLTLSSSTRALFEREANQGAAELLFQRDLFTRVAADYPIGIAEIIDLSRMFGTSIHATFRRFIETHHAPVAGVVAEVSPCTLSPISYRRCESLHSVTFSRLFGPTSRWPQILKVTDLDILAAATQAPAKTIRLKTRLVAIDSAQEVEAELYNTSYRLLVLLWIPQRRVVSRAKRVIRLDAAAE